MYKFKKYTFIEIIIFSILLIINYFYIIQSLFIISMSLIMKIRSFSLRQLRGYQLKSVVILTYYNYILYFSRVYSTKQNYTRCGRSIKYDFICHGN